MEINMISKNLLVKILVIFFIFVPFLIAQNIAEIEKSDWEGGIPDGCTTVTVGKLASFDGSVMTSHTDDSHRTRSWLDVVPPLFHKKGEQVTLYKREKEIVPSEDMDDMYRKIIEKKIIFAEH